uniref:Uncharacterized protein n=1 Tax=Palpitomonas bilix TaxID=652834 RepID=A0A7S3DJE4_9EUKA|mmetsp:Transcript_39523/g.101461  ORF Transcript_39523/g.101461 Transcript_39523/m.101461 type:complete len:183 (+) Transcript_39523:66-614(+)
MKRRAEAAVKDKLKWSSFDRFPYSDSSLPLSDEVMPTHAFQQLVVLLAKLATAVKASISAQACVQVVSSVIEEIGMQMLDEEVFWSSSHGGGSVDDGFGEGGVQQFVLDVRFMLAACAGYVTERASEAFDSLVERALLQYCEETGQDFRTLLRDDKWFQEAIAIALKRMEPLVGRFGYFEAA